MSIIIILLIVLLLFGSPYYGAQNNWGYGPYGGVGLVILILIIYLVMGGHFK